MSDSDGDGGRERRIRAALVVYFPMFIATLSLITAIFNGYLNAKFVDIIQRNVGRAEYMRTCKDAIDAYFQVKARASLMRARAAGTAGVAPEEADGIAAVSRFAALGTYLANLRDEDVRARYTELSRELEKIMREVGRSTTDLTALFEPADRLFAEMNRDCIRSAQSAPM